MRIDHCTGLASVSGLLRSAIHEESDSLHSSTCPRIRIISEYDPGYVFTPTIFDLVQRSSRIPASGEGFYQNSKKQIEMAQYLIYRLGLKYKSNLLEVGPGTNMFVAEEFARAEIQTSTLDVRTKERNRDKKTRFHPPAFVKDSNGIKVYDGDVSLISDNLSVLRDERFGIILFNGSWDSRGHNFTCEYEIAERVKERGKSPGNISKEFLYAKKNEVLAGCKNHLHPGGGIVVISSRYAYLGAGYDFENLPEEKISFLDLMERLIKLGAREIYLFGISRNCYENTMRETYRNKRYKDPKMHDREKILEIGERLYFMDKLLSPGNRVVNNSGQQRKSEIRNALEAYRDSIEYLTRIDAITAVF